LLTCLDAPTGNLIWQVDLVPGEEIPLRFGFSASPLVVEGKVFVTVGGKNRTLVAYDLNNGQPLWSRGDFPASYSTPQFWQSTTGKAVLLFHGKGLSCFDFESGQIQWTHDWVTNPPELNNVCQPVPIPSKNSAQQLIFLSSGYGEGCALLEISSKQKRYSVRERWWNLRVKAKFSSVVYHAGHIYGLDNRKLVCLDADSGSERWRGGRFGYGQLMLVDRQLVIMAESGLVALVDATPKKYQLRGQFQGLPGRTWNHPALSGNWLVIRNDRVAGCWRLPRRTTHD